MKKLRIYLDTSVIGGCLDEEFSEASNSLLEKASRGEVLLMISSLTQAELNRAPLEIQKVLEDIPEKVIEPAFISIESESLRDKYLDAGVVGASSSQDAHHVAIATVERADIIVSWNFKHIVHFDKIRGFNAVNLREGYPPIEIHCPLEVI